MVAANFDYATNRFAYQIRSPAAMTFLAWLKTKSRLRLARRAATDFVAMTPAVPHRFGPRRGDVVTVRQVRGSLRLPEGLAEGDRVRLAGFERGY